MEAYLNVGQPVHYDDGYGKPQNGIVKSHSFDSDCVFVVYHCGNYQNYTGASTQVKDLKEGWI